MRWFLYWLLSRRRHTAKSFARSYSRHVFNRMVWRIWR
jgi:hypothetical protein